MYPNQMAEASEVTVHVDPSKGYRVSSNRPPFTVPVAYSMGLLKGLDKGRGLRYALFASQAPPLGGADIYD